MNKNKKEIKKSYDSMTVYLNGQKICTASQGEHGSVSARISVANGSDTVAFNVVGFSSLKGLFFTWFNGSLKIGDEIIIVLDQQKDIDKPIEIKTVEEMNDWLKRFDSKIIGDFRFG